MSNKHEPCIIKHSGIEEELREAQNKLRKLAAHIESSREKERTWTSRKINEELGHSLSILQLDLKDLENILSENQKKSILKIQSIFDSIQSLSEKTEEISQELRPSVLDHLGLIAAVDWQIEKFQLQTGIYCKLSIKSEELDINKHQVEIVFRTFQDILQNFFRQENTNKIKVVLSQEGNVFQLKIIGKRKETSDTPSVKPDSLFFSVIKERIQFVSGKMNMIETPSKEISITINIPVAKQTES